MKAKREDKEDERGECESICLSQRMMISSGEMEKFSRGRIK